MGAILSLAPAPPAAAPLPPPPPRQRRALATRPYARKARKARKARINKALRLAVWAGRFRVEARPCPVCETALITPFDFECGHVVAEASGGRTDVTNLVPVCRTCNGAMQREHLWRFKARCFPALAQAQAEA